MSGIIVLVAIAAIAAAIGYAAYRYQMHQRARLMAIAAAHGLQVDPTTKKPPPIDFHLFDSGSSKKLKAQMWRAGEQDSVFQYQYTSGTGENSTTYRYTAALIDVPFIAPHLTISTESWWSTMKRAVGLRDIEVESPQFNERYQVRCSDDRFAVTMLDPPMIAWMLTPSSGLGTITFEFLGPWMLCHCDQLEVEQLPGMLEWAQTVRAQLPDVLTELYRR